MSDRILIVARMDPKFTSEVARLFADSDESDLPAALGVARRDLYAYQGLYFHSVEFAGDSTAAMAVARERSDFRQLSSDLEPHIAPFDPATWRSPQDAMAQRFYGWTRETGTELLLP